MILYECSDVQTVFLRNPNSLKLSTKILSESHLVAPKKNIPKTKNVDPDHLAGAQLQILHFICKRNSVYLFWSPSFR